MGRRLHSGNVKVTVGVKAWELRFGSLSFSAPSEYIERVRGVATLGKMLAELPDGEGSKSVVTLVFRTYPMGWPMVLTSPVQVTLERMRFGAVQVSIPRSNVEEGSDLYFIRRHDVESVSRELMKAPY